MSSSSAKYLIADHERLRYEAGTILLQCQTADIISTEEYETALLKLKTYDMSKFHLETFLDEIGQEALQKQANAKKHEEKHN